MEKNALIIIDMQNYYINKHTKSLPKKILKFTDKNKFDHILFTKFVNTKNSNFIKVFNWKKMMSSPEIDIHKTFSKLITKNNVFKKNTYSVFKSKELTKYLNSNNIKNIFLCGLDEDACILASAYEGFDLGYKINVLTDLTMSHCGKKFENAALKIINKNIQQK